jgi:8-oxo-dGTP diphosphatase
MERTPNIFGLSIPVLALDVVIFTIYKDALCVVSIPGKNETAKGRASLPGGIVANGESLEQAFDRILKETTGISGIYKEQLYTFGDPHRDSRGHVVSVVYYALVDQQSLVSQIDLTKVLITPIAQVSKNTFAYDHSEIVAYAKQRLEWKMEYTNVAQNILHDRFTLTALQNIYEIVFERVLDKRNFRKKILALGLIRETGETDKTGSRRPARLYEFVDADLKIMQKRELTV